MGKMKWILTPQDEGLKLSREEFAEADGKPPWRYERKNGRLVVMVPAGHDHHRTVKSFRNSLGAYEIDHPEIVEDVFQESWTRIDEGTERIPDIAVYLTTSRGKIPERVPELIFEIVSEGRQNRRRDYEVKREEFARIGVREYVIVDRFDHRVTVLTLIDGLYADHILGPGDVYSSPLLPGLEIPLAGIL